MVFIKRRKRKKNLKEQQYIKLIEQFMIVLKRPKKEKKQVIGKWT